MDLLLAIAGILIGLYTASSVLGLWLAQQVMDAVAEGGSFPEALEEAPDHHIELMATYALGWRRTAWRVSVLALMTSLIALIASSPLAFWALGIAIAIDVILFLTYLDMRHFLRQTSTLERVLDVVQSLVLLAILALFYWQHAQLGQIAG